MGQRGYGLMYLCTYTCVHVSLSVRGAHIKGWGIQAATVYQKHGVWGESYFDSNHNAGFHGLSSQESNSKHEALSTCQKESYTTHPYKPILLDKEALAHAMVHTHPHRRTFLIYKH